MNKIIFHAGLLIFTLSLIYFSRTNTPVEEILLKSFLVFFILTFMLGVITILFMKSINKTTLDKGKATSKSFDRN